MIRLTYKGHTRLIEPYSISFKRRGNGVAREYFYAYDTTGGMSSGPGIKTFLPDRIQSIETTDIEFEPRFEMELSKSVESSSTGYFGQSFGNKKVGYRRTSISKHRYTIECPVCNRRFPRSTRTAKLNKHKDEYGNQCYGNRGIFV